MIKKKTGTKAQPFDCVMLVENLTLHASDTKLIRHGSRGAIVEAYTEPFEAYDIEFVDESGNIIGLASAVRPEQFEVYWKHHRFAQ